MPRPLTSPSMETAKPVARRSPFCKRAANPGNSASNAATTWRQVGALDRNRLAAAGHAAHLRGNEYLGHVGLEQSGNWLLRRRLFRQMQPKAAQILWGAMGNSRMRTPAAW